MDLSDFFPGVQEKPLDRLVNDGGLFGIFRTVACVGDSLSSGEFEALDKAGNRSYHDMYEYSWGQYLARMAGCKVYNFSRGGMSAKWYCETFADEKDFWNPDLAAQAYIFALGVNDLMGLNMEIGSTADICKEDYTKNAPTFAGYYAQIIQRLKAIQPNAKFFFMTMPKAEEDDAVKAAKKEGHAKLLYDLADYFGNAYVLDLYQYAPTYTKELKERFYLHGHLSPMGYLYTAKMVASYVDFIIRCHPRDFAQVGFIGTPQYDPDLK